ncbi:transmembrane channel-like protein 4 isoform X2 [Pseudophryne corroboree]|uniref:transmembrane channel-like protein 4 isoform X2 n=1 Tax=Pseudophryne corroboree TaxID=495146 RepID=UPI003081CA96
MHHVEDEISDPHIHPLGTETRWRAHEPPQSSLRYRGNEDQNWREGIQSTGGNVLVDNWVDACLEDDRPIKELIYPMQQKRTIRKKKERNIAKNREMDNWKEHKRCWRRFKSTMSGCLQHLILWRDTLQMIGGHYGTGIESYFTFLRFLVIMNFGTFLLIGGFIVIPNILFEKLEFQQTFLSTNSNDTMCYEYNPNPQGLERYYIFIMNILMGTGFMELTYMFYGFYKNTAVNLAAFSYNIPLAYLITTLIYFLLSLLWTVVRSVQGFKQSLVTQDASMTSYTDKVFAGWDFCMKDEKIIMLKQKSIQHELKVLLEEEKMMRLHAQRTMCQRVGIYTLRIFLNFFVVCLIGGAFYCIYRSTVESQKLLENESVKNNFILELLTGYLPSIVITAANFILPMIFNISIKWEKYLLSVEIRLTLIRCVFLRLASLGMLLYSLWNNITCNGNKDDENCKTCGYNYGDNKCWETRVGQEMYKLMIFDFLTVLVVILLVDFPRKMMVDHCSCKPIQLWGQQEFLVPQCVLDIIYGQTVCWIGTFFCPLLPLLNTIKYFIIFYMKRLTLFSNCRPADRTFRASSANFFFLLVLLLGLGLSWVPVLYSVFSMTPSKACGPFRGQVTIWQTITTSVQSLPTVARNFFLFIGSQAFAIPLFIVSCIFMFYLMALRSSYRKLVTILKSQLLMEKSRKTFLNGAYQ